MSSCLPPTYSLCTPLPGSFIRLQTQGYFISPMLLLEQNPLAPAASLTVLQWNLLPSDIHHIQSSHAFKTALKIHLYKHQQVLSNSAFLLASPSLPSLITFFLLARVCMFRVWVCAYVYVCEVFMQYIFVDLVIKPFNSRCGVLTLVREIQHYIYYIWPILKTFGGGDSSVVRAPDSWLKGRGFESLLERRENFLLQGRLSVLTLISVSVPPPCYHSST